MDIRDLQETANLAHLNLSEEELKAAFPAFEEMLQFFAAMQTADLEEKSVSGSAGSATIAEGMAASARTVNSGYFRPDNPKPRVEGLSEEMLQKAGERDGSFIVIHNVL
jgi:aspartyl-tRNA(Asn)/glutamyl-tRNA(Gln) amidotransferase subunit C